jgi:hypothetical protein
MKGMKGMKERKPGFLRLSRRLFTPDSFPIGGFVGNDASKAAESLGFVL